MELFEMPINFVVSHTSPLGVAALYAARCPAATYSSTRSDFQRLSVSARHPCPWPRRPSTRAPVNRSDPGVVHCLTSTIGLSHQLVARASGKPPGIRRTSQVPGAEKPRQ